MSTEFNKTTPHSIHAEHSLLGGLMLDPDAWDKIANVITTNDFHIISHQIIFREVSALAETGSPIDPITISERLKNTASLDGISWHDYLTSIAINTPTAANIVQYAQIIRRNSILRHLIQVGTDITESAYNAHSGDVTELLIEAENKVLSVAEHGITAGAFQKLDDLLSVAIEEIEAKYTRQTVVTGLTTGFTEFDLLTAGLHPGELVVIAGRPAMGKTSYAMGIAAHVAIKLSQPVAVFSLEMPAVSLATRLLSYYSRVPYQHIRTGQLLDKEWPAITETLRYVSAAKLFIDDTGAIATTALRSRARRLKREHGGLALVVIDYLQLVQASRHINNRAEEISNISRSLKVMAKELSVPVVVLSQLNRGVEQRTDKRPVISDLRESGAIEQDADLIAFIYRDEVYNPDSSDRGIAEIIVGKQRNGPTGVVRLNFRGEFTCFENINY